MPETITSTLVAEKNTLHSTGEWVWLVEVQVDDSTAARLAGSDAAITYDGQTWSPFPMAIEPMARSADGRLPEVRITVSNLTGEMAEYLEDADLIDRQAKVLVYVGATGEAMDWGTFEILGATVTLQGCTFRLGLLNPLQAPFPAQRYSRTRCRHQYGGAACDYNLDLPNLISGTNPDFDETTCDLSRDGANGCEAHGDNEVANGLPRKHPLRWGAFPGIPKGRGRR